VLLTTNTEIRNQLVGLYDITRTGGALGQLLMLLEELAILREENNLPNAEVFIINDIRQMDGPFGGNHLSDSNQNIEKLRLVTKAIVGISDCIDLSLLSSTDVSGLLQDKVLWPHPRDILNGRHNYDSTLFIQKHYKKNGRIPRLSVKDELLGRAVDLIRDKSKKALSVAVHLKSNPKLVGQSNANLAAWRSLFIFGQSFPAHFFLVGDEQTNADFRDLPNVSIAYDANFTLDGYLALIQACELFMGMMSGPGNMALFGAKPYVIFKNPDHHVSEMFREIGSLDRYSFSTGHQRVLRTWDTEESLVAAFNHVALSLKSV
jgi:hypothetical protein